MLQNLKELAAESEYDKDVVSNLIPQLDSDNIKKSRYHITTKSTAISVLICQTGMYIPWQTVSNKWIGTIIKYWVLLKKRNEKMTWSGS